MGVYLGLSNFFIPFLLVFDYTWFMQKKKDLKHKKTFGKPTLFGLPLSLRFLARIFVINSPVVVILIALMVMGEIGLIPALIFFLIIFVITAIITAFVFQELENFITYLRNLAQGQEVEAPRFHHGIFGSFRLADAFLSVKNLWTRQTLSDARILERLPDPLIMINEGANIVFANHIARDFFGDDILHKPVQNVFSETQFSNALGEILLKKATTEWFDFDLIQDEQSYSFRTRIERLPATAKNNAIAVIVLHDVSAFKLFKQQQADFFANASHELKTPLSILSGLIETLQGPAKDDESAREKFLILMAEQTNRMTHLVQGLLTLSRLQIMDKTAQTDVILLPDLLQSVIESLTIKAAASHKKLSLQTLHDLPRLIGNRAELLQAFQNLVDNAIKYSANHSTITIKTQLCNGFPKKSDRYFEDVRQVISISVHNVGNPIPAAQIPRIFERFYRMNSVKSKQAEGTGLGLGIVQQIIQKHDGIIDVTSSATAGTAFTAYLPIDF